MKVLLLALVLTLSCVGVASGTPPKGWVPDKAFARVMKVGYEAANKGTFISADVCVKKGQVEACVAIATKNGKPQCFELVYAPPIQEEFAPCKYIRASIKTRAKPSWVVHYPKVFVA